MFQHLVNRIFFQEKTKVKSVINDIGTIYNCIKENGEINNEFAFQNNYPKKYWNYLNYYPFLKPDEQEYLITGCLNIILFLIHKHIENNGTLIAENYADISKAVNNFQPKTDVNEKLYYMVKEALILSWKKMNNFGFDEKRNNIYQSISWTLKYTIIKNSPDKIKNQR